MGIRGLSVPQCVGTRGFSVPQCVGTRGFSVPQCVGTRGFSVLSAGTRGGGGFEYTKCGDLRVECAPVCGD